MISVLTLTYKRPHLLEEAIQSFLEQETLSESEYEMIIINDNPDVDYIYNHEKVRIINRKERFSSISAKLEWGFKQCKHNYIYRLDDDDLLAPWALKNVQEDINNNLGYEIYRSKGHHFFVDNVYVGEGGSINNGNVYTQAYLNRIIFPGSSFGEDSLITFGNNSNIFTSKLEHTMIYRWGMGTLHISGMGQQSNETILDQADKVLDNTIGEIVLTPHFDNDYYGQIKKQSILPNGEV
jgi:glycosyltransferase involved in cell wall biosynthesis